MGSRVSIEKERQDVGVEGVPCAAVSGEQDSEEEGDEDEGGVGNDMQMNNNNNNNHEQQQLLERLRGPLVPKFLTGVRLNRYAAGRLDRTF